MRCSNCGRQIPDNNFTRINGSYYCNDCAADMGFSFFNMNFNSMDGIKQALSAMEELEFANNVITCSNCGMTLREFENTGKLGCISCFNAFGNEIGKRLLRLYGSEEFMGRQPGEQIEFEYDKDTPAPAKAAGTKEAPAKDITERIAKADFGTLSDEMLKEALDKAIAKEDYILAARLRDELNSRKGDNGNG